MVEILFLVNVNVLHLVISALIFFIEIIETFSKLENRLVKVIKGIAINKK